MNQCVPATICCTSPADCAKTPAGTRTLGPALAAGKPTHRSVTQYRQTSVGPKGLRERAFGVLLSNATATGVRTAPYEQVIDMAAEGPDEHELNRTA